MASSLFLFLLLAFATLSPPVCASILNRRASLSRSHPVAEPTSLSAAPITYFEVTKPIPLPKTKPYSYLILQHEFADTYGKPPVTADYKPPSDFQKFSKIVLEWTATAKGRQFDRIFGVWIGGVEILRSCTAEPTKTGIIWTVKKDITKYSSVLSKEQTVAVYLGNLIDDTYTAVYHVNLTFHFYPADEIRGQSSDSTAALVIPVSRNPNLPSNDGQWFNIQSYTDHGSKLVQIPQNTYRAVLEVYVSFHETDEFWYGNLPSEYTKANRLTDDYNENGPFREVLVGLDGAVIAAIWPFSVIFTGGLNPLLWRPITAIGSFDLPTYDVEITPFLGKLLDGEPHNISFTVTNALNVWLIDANLHVWLDPNSEKTSGELLNHSSSPLSMSLQTNFKASNGSFITKASRSITSTGTVKSSHGIVTTESRQELKYRSNIVTGMDGNLEILYQRIKSTGKVDARNSTSPAHSSESSSMYSLYTYSEEKDGGDGEVAITVNVTLGMDEKRKRVWRSGRSISRVKNLQRGDGYLVINGKNLSGVGRTEQDYYYGGDEWCYSRKIRSSNYSILHDKVSESCKIHGGDRF
ncbi:peptide-N4-(N-acetyl-beta-glucosaminyl)asparagine amidase A-like [Andrographis paniculata]|uniref:peptide-N4-(N-acetyl-beta- glucosaminyl)asparagine amidase A-like n=1 Tax=Andrographis paniculata TaxID=175694 RepID=UPI0021E85DC7|nr:peptide-N4-(N-acetyl-beta-glucosaminyl)asparagine amidase A-like [Andrographis paniculata]